MQSELQVGVNYLANNPERFIESIVDTSWSQYLSSISMQGTWANHVIIQAVADALNLKIYIIESNQKFREMTLVEPSNVIQNPRLIYIDHRRNALCVYISYVMQSIIKMKVTLLRQIIPVSR